LKTDPEKYNEYLKKKWEYSKRYFQKIKEDLEKYEKYIKRNREYKRVYHRKIKSDPEKYKKYLERKQNYKRKARQIKAQEKTSKNEEKIIIPKS